MTPTRRALLLAALHLALAASIGGKFLFDRSTRPRYWLKTAPVDPDLPIRGRYVSLRVEVPVQGATLPPPVSAGELEKQPWRKQELHGIQVALHGSPEGLVALAAPARTAQEPSREANTEWVAGSLSEALRGADPSRWVVLLSEPLACFIPEHVPDPSRRPAGEELWVEATLPRKGPLRPIRLGVKKEGKLTPLPY